MYWTWQSVTHVILLQLVIAVYYLLWPLCRRGFGILSRTIKCRRDDLDPAAKELLKKRSRGEWRDIQYQQGERADTAKWRDHQQRRKDFVLMPSSARSKHLNVLGLREPVHLIEVKTAYRTLANRYHPDHYAAPHHSDAARDAAAKKMQDVNAAYDWLRSNA